MEEKMIPGELYSFTKLQEFLIDSDRNIYLIVENTEMSQTAVMHVFMENFCGDWRSGDGVLFYADGETHSANEDDLFRLVEIRNF